MAEFQEVIKQTQRMCKHYDGNCKECRINIRNNGKNLMCNDLVLHYPQEAEEIILEWAKEHPVKTNADKFIEVFGDIFKDDEMHKGCQGFDCYGGECGQCPYYKFWDREYKEPQGE